MKIIFLATMYASKYLDIARKNSKKGMQMAPHFFQNMIIEGLENNPKVELKVLNIPPIGSYPINYKKIWISKEKWGKNYEQIGYLNLPILKKKIIEKIIFKKICKIMQADPFEKFYILSYGLYIPFIKVLNKLKAKFGDRVIDCIICTDCVPGRGDFKRNDNLYNKLLGNYIVKIIKKIDKFILLSKFLEEILEIQNKPKMILECIANIKQKENYKNSVSYNRCLYAGTLEEEYGILEIIEAFKKIENSELWICGDGPIKNEIIILSNNCCNIKYFGFLSQEELNNLRDQCDFLINPRKPTGTFTKYSFPSKTSEYLMSAKPVIMYKLEPIPDEYDDYLIYLNSFNTDDVICELKNIFSTDYSELVEKGLRGRNFVINNKNNIKQSEKILNFLKNK